MKRTLAGVCLLLLSSLSQSKSIQVEVDQLINQINPNVNIGAIVVDLTSGDTLYRKNADQLFIPASNMKLFSEAAALMVLGPDYRFKNNLSISSGTIQHGILQSDLTIQLSGDPSFNRNDIKNLLFSLKKWNINTILGTIFIDSSLAQIDPYPSGWLPADLSYDYGAPNAPLIIDANRMTVTVNPGAHEGDLALVELDDDSTAIELTNQVITKKSTKGCGLSFNLDEKNHLTVRGCVGIGQWAVQQRIAIKNPLLYAKKLIRNELAQASIKLNGKIQLGKTPPDSLLVASNDSKPLSQLMADTLKPSDNLYADSLYLHTAAKINGSPVNWPTAELLIKSSLEAQTGINFKNAVFSDGSGLSRDSLVTPAQTIALLQFLYHRFPLSYEYISALPVSGRDGTLQKRFRIPMQQGFIRAKTGTMSGINSLSGYLYAANGHILAFAIYVNTPPGAQSEPGRPLVDALCTYFLQKSPDSTRFSQIFSPNRPIRLQSNTAQVEQQKKQYPKWRHLESSIRNALKNQPVTIIYRENELIVNDTQEDPNKVWNVLQNLVKKYPFAVMLSSQTLAIKSSINPKLFWVQKETDLNQAKRTWNIYPLA